MADPQTYRPAPGAIPTDPGVYRFSDPHGVVIYVGKAKNLRQRLNSYFADIAGLHPRTQAMVKTAAKVEWTVVQNEVESLQLEYTWIKLYDPRFNVKYRDDKSYPWLCITASEEFPRVFVGRGAMKKGNRYFGPYGAAWAIRDTVDLLLRVFPMRSCTTGVFRNAKAAGRPCLLGYIGKCSAPCVDRISAEGHRVIVNDFSAFMRGESAAVLRRTEKAMKQAAMTEEYELAAKYRDDLVALRKATEHQAIVLTDGTDADVLALAEDPLEVAVQIFHVRDGRVRGERGWVADRVDDGGTAELVERALVQLYEGVEDAEAIPRLILVPALPPSDALAEWLGQRRGTQVHIRVPQRGDKRVLLDTVAKNAAEALVQHKTKRASDLTTRSRALEEIQEAVGLPEAPLRIECYDISHTQGQEVVGSMVVFEDGLPRKSEYRRFIIKSVEGSNDFAAMHEVLTRRFKRLAEDRALLATGSQTSSREVDSTDVGALIDPVTGAPRKFAYAPQLIVVDGGAPQVSAAQQVLDELGITDVALCGLAKRLEEIWLPGEDYPYILPRTSEGLYLLQRVRDEAHRFAIAHHRGRRGKALLESTLDDIPGLGESRRKALITHFGSVRRLRRASVEDIQSLPGFGPTLAEAIVTALAAEPVREAINMTTGEITQL